MTAASQIVRRDPATFGRARTAQASTPQQSRAIAEMQAAVIVSQSNPRDDVAAEREMESVCRRPEMAEQAFYQVDRTFRPSVHLARELARIWGNLDYGVKELDRDDQHGVSEVLAFAWDVQKNSRSSRVFLNPHQRTEGALRVELTDLQDIYLSNQNVGARAVREVIFSILPRWFVEKAQNICRLTLEAGDGTPLHLRIAAMVGAFDSLGVTEAQLEARLEHDRNTWTPADLAQLTVLANSIRRGEVRSDELFTPTAKSSAIADEIAPASSPTADSADPAPITRRQLADVKRLLAAHRNLTVPSHPDTLQYVGTVVGHEIHKLEDLTTDEAKRILAEFTSTKEK
ncbi:hypothetical protein H7J86_24205 [Mycobacterium hackensackense]|uniref:hypothetical protein n=1 Tax=Mycobacterium hackensackense TaxID=228909 RepID=UPI002265A0F9|nr:hypothetical protein [Mycobacterium hackensackense]MCV7255270.1 hypothetical protein [Mycobacterium hackensackense]